VCSSHFEDDFSSEQKLLCVKVAVSFLPQFLTHTFASPVNVGPEWQAHASRREVGLEPEQEVRALSEGACMCVEEKVNHGEGLTFPRHHFVSKEVPSSTCV